MIITHHGLLGDWGTDWMISKTNRESVRLARAFDYLIETFLCLLL